MNKLRSGLCLLTLAGFAGGGVAQAIGTAVNVQGLVTVSDASSVNTVVQGAPVMNGTRFVTSSTGSVTLKVNRDCEFPLKPNQSLVVTQDKTCEQLVAMVQPLPGAPAANTLSAAGSNDFLVATGALLLLLAGGAGGGGAAPSGGGGGGQLPEPPPISGQ